MKINHFIFFLPFVLIILGADIVVAETSVDFSTYSSKGHGKSAGFDVSLQYPNKWTKKEGKGEQVVQYFESQLDDDIKMNMVIEIKNIPFWLIKDNQAATNDSFYSSGTVSATILSGAKLDSIKRSLFGGRDGIQIIYEWEHGEYKGRTLLQIIACADKWIGVSCGIAGDKKMPNKINKAFEDNLLLFQIIQQSVLINDERSFVNRAVHYNASLNSANKTLIAVFGDDWIFSVILSFFVTYTIGLLPPILLRFRIFKRQLSCVESIFMIIGFYVMNLTIFIALGSQSKTHGALIIIAFISFSILRKRNRAIKGNVKIEHLKTKGE